MSSTQDSPRECLFEKANAAAKRMVYLWARDAFRETFVAAVKQIVEKELVLQLQADSGHVTDVVVSDQMISDANEMVKRLGDKWMDCLQNQKMYDVSESVRAALLHGKFLVTDNNHSSVPLESTNISNTSTINASAEELQRSTSPRNDNYLLSGDTCGLFSMAKQKLLAHASSSTETSNDTDANNLHWRPLPRHVTSSGMHLPNVAGCNNNHESLFSDPFHASWTGGVFGTPNPHLQTWEQNQDQYHQNLIDKIDADNKSTNPSEKISEYPYDWSFIEEAAKAIPERLHTKKKSTVLPSKLQSLEVVPKSTIETEHLIHENDEQLLSSNESNALLGCVTFQRDLERKKRKRIREREEVAITYPHQNTRDITSESIISHERGRPPSTLPNQIILDLSDTEEYRNSIADQLLLLSGNNEEHEKFSTIQGGLKILGEFHCEIQSKVDGKHDEENGNVLLKTKHRKMKRERLGKTDKDMRGVPNINKYIVSKVARVAQHGQDWLEFDLGETLLYLYDEDAGSDNTSGYKLYAFRSLEASVEED